MAQPQLVPQSRIEVLAPKLDLKAQIAKTTDVEELFRTCFITTDRAAECCGYLNEMRILKQCGRIIGPRNVGKSRTILHYFNENIKVISCVKAWSESSSRRLFSQILKNINHAAPMGKREDLHQRLAGSLESFGLKLLIVDNAQNLQRQALIDLKQLYEDSSKVPIVLVGNRELDTILEDCGLLTEFPLLHEFEHLECDDFRKTLTIIESDILSLPEASNLTEGNIFEILAASTNGRIGILVNILTKAVLYSLKKGFSRIDETILANVASRYGTKYIPFEKNNKKSK